MRDIEMGMYSDERDGEEKNKMNENVPRMQRRISALLFSGWLDENWERGQIDAPSFRGGHKKKELIALFDCWVVVTE